jgi:hypothetical protein
VNVGVNSLEPLTLRFCVAPSVPFAAVDVISSKVLDAVVFRKLMPTPGVSWT